jgi:3-hydroxyisobutyrate dehydrogenase
LEDFMRIGYIGLGNLGGHMAMNLVRNGFRVTVHDRDRSLADRHVAAGGQWAPNSADLAGACDVVMTCLPSPAICETVLSECISTMKAGSVWIENSTLGRDEIVRLAALAQERGIRVLEAPVTGGVHLAARGEITVLAGGDTALFDEMTPILRSIGNQLFHMGPIGSAAVIKVITNMLAFIHLVADGEALMLARRGGLDLGQAWAAIKASSGTSFVHETEGQLILNGSYDIAFTMDLALKDLGFASDFGREFGVPLDLAMLTRETFLKGKAAYGGAAQSTQIVKLLEDALQTDLRAPGFPAWLE